MAGFVRRCGCRRPASLTCRASSAAAASRQLLLLLLLARALGRALRPAKRSWCTRRGGCGAAAPAARCASQPLLQHACPARLLRLLGQLGGQVA